MKLAEALILRADLKKRSEQLRERLRRNAKVQEGDQPAELPEALFSEFEGVAAELEALIRRVNWTNANVAFDDAHRISDAIAMRDTLDLRIRMMRELIDAASARERLFTRTEIKFIMKLKIYPEYVGLCGSCRHASLAKTTNGGFLARCDWFDWSVREPIEICSKYDDRRLPSLRDMRTTAWILRTDEDKKVIGFVSNRQWRKSKEYINNPYWGDEDD